MAQSTISAENVEVDESVGTATVTLRLSAPSESAVRVSYVTQDGSALRGNDYVRITGVVDFPPGTTQVPLSVEIRNDLTPEPTQSFSLQLSNSVGAQIATPSVAVTIVDTDPDPMISLSDIRIVEGSGGGVTTAYVKIRLSRRSEKTVRFTMNTSPNSASEFEFVPFNARFLFDSTTNIFEVPIEIVADDELEGQQRLFLFLRNPANAWLNPDQFPPNGRTDRIRSTVTITDDDVLTFPQPIQSQYAFAWVGKFGKRFNSAELDAVAMNYDFVVLSKFHANFDIAIQQDEIVRLKSRKPGLRTLCYSNIKFWFEKNRWGTTPSDDWLLHDQWGNLVEVDTDRSLAYYLDLRIPECREWMLAIIDEWLATGLYEGVIFDSVKSIGDFDGGTFWLDLLGSQAEIDRWNEGMRQVVAEAQYRFENKLVLFNGIGRGGVQPPDGDPWRLEICDGAMTERFAIELNGEPTAYVREDIDLIASSPNKIFLCKSNMRYTLDVEAIARSGRFAFAAFLMAYNAGTTYFKFAVDDFYTSSELEDDPVEMQLALGLPIEPYQPDGLLLSREFENGIVALNLGSTSIDWTFNGVTRTVPAHDALFILF
jgi:Hypothetical glycosyl hydrolase family 15/Calx-beta domain